MFYLSDDFGYLPGVSFKILLEAKKAAKERARTLQRTIYIYRVSKLVGRFDSYSSWIRMR